MRAQVAGRPAIRRVLTPKVVSSGNKFDLSPVAEALQIIEILTKLPLYQHNEMNGGLAVP